MKKHRAIAPESLRRFDKMFEEFLDGDPVRRMIELRIDHLDGSNTVLIEVGKPWGISEAIMLQYCFRLTGHGNVGFCKFSHLMSFLIAELSGKYGEEIFVTGFLRRDKNKPGTAINLGLDSEDDRWTDDTMISKPRKPRG